MYSILNNVTHEKVIQKSRFIVELIKLENIDNIKNILNEIKEKYPNANHYCYGYRFHGMEKASDDGEPGGTAGMPILNILQKRDIEQVLAIVIRYFGGIKLGAGGLVRAYSSSVKEALEHSLIVPLIKGYQVSFGVTYEEQSSIERKLSQPYTKTFTEYVTYSTILTEQELDNLNKEKMIFIEQNDECFFTETNSFK